MKLVDLAYASVGYDRHEVLRDITLTIERGERIALVGESGAGKSTLLKFIYDRCAQEIALVPQNSGLVEALSVFHNVYMGRLHQHSTIHNLRNLLFPAKREVAAVRKLLKRLRLDDKLFTAVGELSGGQQQRTAVGRALYRSAGILIGDEPVSAVDEHQAREILEIINSESDTVVLAMHDRALALSYTDRVVGLKGGRIVLDQPTAGMAPADLDHVYEV